MSIPQQVRPFFWDLGLRDEDLTAYPDYTIGRLLEMGDDPAVQWMRETFPRTEIERVIRTERRLSRRSANFWALVYGIPAGEVAALRME